MQYLIRAATEIDVPGILDITNHEILTSTVIYYYEERTIDQHLSWFREKRLAGLPLYVAVQNNLVLGYATYGPFRSRPAYARTIEHSVYVHHEHHGKGVGSTLMTRLLSDARDKGYHTMIAGIDSRNADSYKFHIKFGFEEIGRCKQVGYKFNMWLDVIFMQLML
ncbi:MAG: N-acetyltransferase family protein [Bacteroidota bacterium]